MMNLDDKPALKKSVYGMAISMTVIGVLFITGKMFSKVELSNVIEPRQNIILAESKVASISKVKDYIKTTSRSSQEVRNSANEKSKNTQDNKKESSKTTTNNNSKKTTKKVEQKQESSKQKTTTTTTKKEENSKTTTTTKKEGSTTKKENKKSATKTTSISQVRISKTMDLTKRTGLSRNDFIKSISGVKADTSGFFEKNAGKIYDLCEKYSINEIFFCGLISAESGWNIASNHRKTHNYISLMSGGKLIKYNSVDEGLEVAAQKLHYNYLTPGGKFYHGKTLAGVKTCFCPSGSWVNLVYGRMKQIL